MRHPLDLIVDRPRRDAALAVFAAWLGFVVGLAAGGDVGDVSSLMIAVGVGGPVAFLGFAAASRCRRLPVPSHRARRALVSLAAGLGLGIANLLANRGIAAMHPTFRSLLTQRITTAQPMVGIVGSPLVEEVLLRLFLMSVIAWIVWRVSGSNSKAFTLSLIASSVFFALPHLSRPVPADPSLANLYRLALVTKYTLSGVPLGWLFWRWGLPFAIICHLTANAAHLAMQRLLF